MNYATQILPISKKRNVKKVLCDKCEPFFQSWTESLAAQHTTFSKLPRNNRKFRSPVFLAVIFGIIGSHRLR